LLLREKLWAEEELSALRVLWGIEYCSEYASPAGQNQNHQQQGNLVLMNFQPAKERMTTQILCHGRATEKVGPPPL
jgi:hypothetical protein